LQPERLYVARKFRLTTPTSDMFVAALVAAARLSLLRVLRRR